MTLFMQYMERIHLKQNELLITRC